MTIRLRWLIKGLGPGGAETLLVSTARRLDPHRYRVQVDYLLPWKDHLAPALRATGVEVRCLDVNHPGDVRWVGRFLQGIDDVDVVHVHSPLLAGMVRPLLRMRRGRPALVSTEHNRWESFPAISRAANRASMRWTDTSIAVSEDVRRSMGRWGVRAETVVHGVDLDQVQQITNRRTEMRTGLGIADSRLAVLTIANLRANKAYPDLLCAARDVTDSHPSVDFLAAGQGPLEDELRALAATLRLGDRFRFLGFQPDAYRLLAAADLFVLASHHEGYPVSLMEAMASGIPIVATAVGGVREAIRDGIDGRLVTPGRPHELSEAILEVLGREDRGASMGLAAQERAGMFDIGSAVDRLAEIYDTVARS